MSTNIGSVVVALKAQDEVSGVIGQVQGAIGSLTGVMSKMGGPMAELGASINSTFSGFATGGPAGAALAAGTFAIGEVITGIQNCVKEASASEAVWASLGAAVERSGKSWEAIKTGTESALLSMSKVTTYSDEQLAAALEKLMSFGISYDDAMKALGATLDFAAAKHMDLDSAATIVGKSIDGNTTLLKRYGLEVDVAKDAADKMTPVLGALNEQFGGAAQAAASTYAGIQERLKNATGEVSEKIGMAFLPALASLTEAMIPVVDWFGQGVDAVGGWLSEVGKMPEVQGIVAAVQDAFAGWWDNLTGFFGFLQDTFGPVLQELWDALKEVFDALAPIGEAFGEVWAAIMGGEEGGDWLKDFLKFVAEFIREVVVPAIREAVPVIRGFAEAFKAAADFALPIITQIKDVVVGFIEVLKDTFYGFYQWLVGGSLWMDMWNQLLSVAGSMIGTLLSDFGMRFFEPMKAAFTGALEAVEGIWNAGLGTIQDVLTNWGDAAQGLMTSIMGSLQGTFESTITAMQGAWTSLTSGLQATTQAAAAPMQAATQGVMDAVGGAVTGFWDWLTGGSYWPEQLEAMRGMTESKLGETAQAFVSFGQQVTTNLQSGLGQAQQVAQQAVGAISQVLGGIGQGITQAFSPTTAQGAKTTAEKLDIFGQAVGKGWQSADNLARSLVILRGNLDASDMSSEKFRQTLEAMGFRYEKNIYGNYQLSTGIEDLRTKLSDGAISAEEMDRALEGIGLKSLAVDLGLATVNTEALGQAMTALGTISDPEAWESNWEALAVGKISFDELIDSMMDNGLTYQQIMSNITYNTQQMATETTSVLDTVTSTFSNAFDTISNAASGLWNFLVGGSLWPDMMTVMEDTTSTAISSILSTMSAGFAAVLSQASAALQRLAGMQRQAASMASSAGASVAAAASTFTVPSGIFGPLQRTYESLTKWPSPPAGLTPGLLTAWREAMLQLNPALQLASYQTSPGDVTEIPRTGPIFAHKGEVIGRPSPTPLNLQNTINVQVDGATIARTVERRLISQRQLAGG